MRTEQRKPARASVIEPSALPTLDIVATGTVTAARSAMHIVRCMTRCALGRGALETIVDMTGGTVDLLMPAQQCETCSGMIEAGSWPGLRHMTGAAVLTQLAAMRIVAAMTVAALIRRFPIFLPRHVTAHARDRRVCALQVKVSLGVVELLWYELDDIGVASLVLLMAPATLHRRCVLQPPMKTFVALQIFQNRLVTTGTQRRLPRAIGAVVAATAIAFKLGMCRSELARHE